MPHVMTILTEILSRPVTARYEQAGGTDEISSKQSKIQLPSELPVDSHAGQSSDGERV